jgi:MFS family permease
VLEHTYATKAEKEPVMTAPPRTPRPLPPRLAGALVFVTSGAVLVLEVAGLRLVGPYVGVTLQTSSAVIGLVLAAIAYGAWAGGWLADRLEPRRMLAPLLLAAAVGTAIVLPVARYAGDALRGTDPARVLLLTALTLFLPSSLLSAVPPLVVKLQLGDLAHTGRVVGSLSSVGTVGGITATLLTGFVLVAALPTTAIVLGLAGALAAGGLALWWYLGVAEGPRARRMLAAAVLVSLPGTALVISAPEPCEVETAYHCARITVDGRRAGGRVLWLNSIQHSYVDLLDPTHLEYEYTQWIGVVTDVMAPSGKPVAALHLGGGGFTLPRYLAATRKGSDNLVFELDGRLVTLARRRLGLRTGTNLRVVTGDARVNLAGQPSRSRDLVIGDAFGHLAVPWHLATRELTADVRRVLRGDGLYVLNIIDRQEGVFARAEIATVASVFRYVAVIAVPGAFTGTEAANWVIVGSDEPLPVPGTGGLRDRLAHLGRPVPVLWGDDVPRFVGRSRALTDDRAPVDQLVSSW